MTKKKLFLCANLSFIYMIMLLCFTNINENNEDVINKNEPAITSTNIKISPSPISHYDIPSTWYISEQKNSYNQDLNKILIAGISNTYNILQLIIQVDTDKEPEIYAPTYFEWSTSDPQIATVKDGRVNAVSAGAVTITADIQGDKKTYDINVYSTNNVDLITEVNNTEVKSEINIDSPIYLSSYLLIKDINFKIRIPIDSDLVKWTSNDADAINVFIDENIIAVPYKASKASIKVEGFGKVSKTDVNITKPNLSNIKYSENDNTYFMKIYNDSYNNLTLGTSIIFPYQVLVLDSKGEIIDIAEYLNWKCTNSEVISYYTFSSNVLNAKGLGKTVYTTNFFNYYFTFNTEVTKAEVSKPELLPLLNNNTPNIPIVDFIAPQLAIYPFEIDNPTPMSEINKKMIYTLKETINDPALINDFNKDSIRIESLKMGYYTQQKQAEIIAIIHIEIGSGTNKVYKEILGIFDAETFTYKTHKVFSAKAPNCININSTSILFIPMDPTQDYMANTLEIWTMENCMWKISWKPKDTMFHRYAIKTGYKVTYIMVFDKVGNTGAKWEFQYKLQWNMDSLTYSKEFYDWNERKIEIAQANITQSPQNQITNYVDSGINLSGFHVICDNLIYKMDKFKESYTFVSRVYIPLRNNEVDKDKAQIASTVQFLSANYGYFTQTDKLEVLFIFNYSGYFKEDEGPIQKILMVCDAETYEVKAQMIVCSLFTTDFNFIKDQAGRSRIIATSETFSQGNSSNYISLLEVNGSSFDRIQFPNDAFLTEDGFALIGDKLIILKKVYFEARGNLPWEYKAEYHWDEARNCFIIE